MGKMTNPGEEDRDSAAGLPMVILVEVQADFTPEEGDAFDAVVSALDFAEIPTRVSVERQNRFKGALEPMAAISVEHLSEATLARLGVDGEGFVGLVHYPNEYGAFLVINQFTLERSGSGADNWPSTWPKDLVDLMDTARSEGLQWLKLDADAPVIDGLAVYPRDGDGESGSRDGSAPRSRP